MEEELETRWASRLVEELNEDFKKQDQETMKDFSNRLQKQGHPEYFAKHYQESMKG